MSNKSKKKTSEIDNGKAVLKAGRFAIRKLIEERKKTDDYLIISRNGKVVKVKARSLK